MQQPMYGQPMYGQPMQQPYAPQQVQGNPFNINSAPATAPAPQPQAQAAPEQPEQVTVSKTLTD